MFPATLTGVGVGPGDPRQVTLAALDALRAAARVVAPSSSAEAVGRAESVVRQVCPEMATTRLVIPMGSSPRSVYRDAARQIAGWLDLDEAVAFVTLGDPNVYSTFTSLAAAVREVRPETPIRTVPGIMAFQVLAASASTTVLDGTQSMTLTTGLDDLDRLDDALENPAETVVVYKGGRRFPEIAKRAASAGRLEGAVAGELLGMPGERVVPLADVAGTPSAYLSTIIIPAVSVEPTESGEGPG